MPYSNLVITGSLAKDTIFLYQNRFEDNLLPDQLSNLSVSFQSPKIIKNLGGPLLNIAYSASFFCKDKIKIFGAVGKDGGDILNFLTFNKLDTRYIIKDENLYTACGSCITDVNNNQIWGFCDGAGELIKDIRINQICDKDSLFLIAPTNRETVLSMVKQAIDLKIDYIYDVGMHIPVLTPDELNEGIDNCKYLIVNEYEMEQIKNKISFNKIKFIQSGKILIITLGEKGVCYHDENKNLRIPAFRSKCLDPVGAGDSWRGCFFGDIVNNKDVLTSLINANVIASLSVETNGGTNYKINDNDFKHRFEEIKKQC
jgi:adenosine kinase